MNDSHAPSEPPTRIEQTPDASPDEAETLDAVGPPPAPSRVSSPPTGQALGRGTSIGRYVLLDRIGAGGMGIVYSAFDPELDRKVAIKLLQAKRVEQPSGALADKPSPLSLRLYREAQAMARLSHPNVTAVYDVGMLAGERLFVAMELVDGDTLGKWLKDQPRDWRQVLDVYRAAGAGLAAAHDAGLVHRDFKPDNVMVGRDGRVRVMDFGLARSVADTEDEPSAVEAIAASPGSNALSAPLTRLGDVQGTPSYMAPEQWRGEPVDARCDQFSFGVALYQALYKERPFEGGAFDCARDSTWIVRQAPRGSRVPTWVRQAVLRCLREHPAQRYPSMHELLVELARDPSVVRRRWLGAAGAVAGVAAVVVGVVALRAQQPSNRELCSNADGALTDIWGESVKGRLKQAFDATGHPRAGDVWARTVTRIDGYAGSWATMRTDACLATRVRGEQSEEVMSLRMACLDRRRRDLAALVGVLAVADRSVVDKAVDASVALPGLASCADLAVLQARIRPPEPAIQAEVARLTGELAEARAQFNAGKARDATVRAEALTKEARRLGYRPLEAETTELWGLTLSFVEPGRATVLWSEAIEAALASGNDELAVQTVIKLIAVKSNLNQLGDVDLLLRVGRSTTERLGRPELLTARVLIAESDFLGAQGKHDLALDALKRALPVIERVAGPDALETGIGWMNLGIELGALGRFEESVAALERSVPIYERLYGPSSSRLGIALMNLTEMLYRSGQFARALPMAERTSVVLEQTTGGKGVYFAIARQNLAETLRGLGRLGDAEATAREAIGLLESTMGEDDARVGDALLVLGAIALDDNRPRDAITAFERARAIAQKTPGADRELALSLTGFGRAQLALGEPTRAIAPLERALELDLAHDISRRRLAVTRFALARALLAARRDATRPRELAMQARADLEQSRSPEVALIDAWLGSPAPAGRGPSR